VTSGCAWSPTCGPLSRPRRKLFTAGAYGILALRGVSAIKTSLRGDALNFSTSIGDDGTTRLTIEGELDVTSAITLRPTIDKLVAMRPQRVEVEAAGLRLIDSSGAAVLVALYKGVRAAGGKVVVVGMRDQPLAIFRMLRLDRVMIET
jgi:anti-sigma B factor antagonist